MCNETEGNFLFNYEWEHVWCDPKDINIKEIVKGPFSTPKLAYPIPRVTLCQREGLNVSWAEDIARKSTVFHKDSQNKELMHKDVDIVPQLKKNYRLCLGQGIPDPWTPFSFIDDSETCLCKDLKNTPKHLYNSKKYNCFCWEKKYLFDCPDKDICHEKNNEKCRCSSIFQSWVLKSADSKLGRKSTETLRSDTSLTNDLKSGALGENLDRKDKSSTTCDCLKNIRRNSDTNTNENSIALKKSDSFSKNQSKYYYCPSVKSKPAGKKNIKKTISRQIQTEIKKNSKTVQTDSTISKPQQKCSCLDIYQCSPPWAKVSYPEPYVGFPLSFTNCFMAQKFCNKEMKRHSKNCFGVDQHLQKDHSKCEVKQHHKSNSKCNKKCFESSPLLKECGLHCLPDGSLLYNYFPSRIQCNSPHHQFCMDSPPICNIQSRKFDLNKYEGSSPLESFESNHMGQKNKHFNSNTQIKSLNQASNTKKIFSRPDAVENDESKNFIKKCNSSCKTYKKHRRLLANRKRRKKLTASAIMEYQSQLNKLHKPPLVVNKGVQIEQFSTDHLKKVSFPHNQVSSDILSRKFSKQFEALKNNEKNKFDKFIEGVTSKETLKQPSGSELKYVKFFDKISSHSGTTWSSNTLKNIVDDLLLENKARELKLKSAAEQKI